MELLKEMNRTQKFLLGTFLFIMAVLICGTIWFGRYETNKVLEAKFSDLHAVAELKIGQIVAWRQERLADVAVHTQCLMRSRILEWMTKPDSTMTAGLLEHFQALKEAYSYWDVLLVATDGRLLLPRPTTDEHLYYNPSELQPVIEKALAAQQAVFGDLIRSTTGNRITLDVAGPVLDDHGRPVAVLIMRIDPEVQLYPLMLSWPLPSPSAETLLVHRDQDTVLFLNELRHIKGAALAFRYPLSDPTHPAVMAILGQTGITQGIDYRGVEVVSDIQPVPETDWYMIAKIDAAEILNEARLISIITYIFVVVGIMMTTAFAAFLYTRQRRNHYKKQYESERARRQAQEEIRATLYGIGDGVIATDTAGKVTRMNPVAEKLTGWSEAEACGRPISEVFNIINEQSRQPVENPVEQVLREGFIVGLANHTLLIDRHGQERPITDSGAPVKDENGELLGTVLVFRDRTEQQKHEAQREFALQVLAILNRNLDSAHLIDHLMQIFKERTGMSAIGIRLRQKDEYPYFRTSGFSEAFLSAGPHRYNLIACRPVDNYNGSGEGGRDVAVPDIAPLSPCMCFTVLQGETDPEMPFFTPYGSFWTNSISELFDMITQSDDPRYARYKQTCQVCREEGYESIALIPLRSGDDIIGLLQLNDHRRDLLTMETIEFLEGIGASIGIALARQQDLETLRASEERYRRTFSTIAEGLIISDQETGAILDANEAACTMYGYTRAEFRTMHYFDLFEQPDDEAAAGLDTGELVEEHRRKDGSVFPVEISISYYEEEGRKIRVMAVHDITERRRAQKEAEAAAAEMQRLLKNAQESRAALLKKLEDEKRMIEERTALEAQLRQQQRLETVGQLAAGIAHDFNNLLTGITGFTQFAIDQLPENASPRQDLKRTLELAKRAENLTRQLLAFSRRQTLQPVVLNVKQLLDNLYKLLGRLLGEHIDLVIRYDEDVGNIKADQGQIEQVLINLAVNSRDAMPDGGTLIIEASNFDLDEHYSLTHADAKPGSYVMLAVSDTGCGMEPEVVERAFEPFFTTKGVGQGTGLGLPTVYGIVKQHEGHISIYSEPGKGTTVKVYLPRVDAEATEPATGERTAAPKGNELLLIVEDEKAVREIAERILVGQGYRVLTAATPEHAEVLLAEHGPDISLILTDVVLPQRSGSQLYQEAKARYPHLRIIYMSGYTDDAIARQGVLEEGTPFIQKPFNSETLIRKVRQVLDS